MSSDSSSDTTNGIVCSIFCCESTLPSTVSTPVPPLPGRLHGVRGDHRAGSWEAETRTYSCYPPKKQGLSQARRGRVVKPNDFGCRHHHSKGIAVLFSIHQESLADMWPGGHKAVIASRNAVVVSRQIAEHFRAN